MKHNPIRDRLNYRRCVDIIDPHNGIGALCELDLIETPMAVMTQGARAAEEIRQLRALVQQIKKTSTQTDVQNLIAGYEAKREADVKTQKDHMATYMAAQNQ